MKTRTNNPHEPDRWTLLTTRLVGLALIAASTACGGGEARDAPAAGEGGTQDAQTVAAGPRISAPEPLFDFGKVKDGAVVEHTFKIVNTGTADLHILDAKGS